MRYSATLAVIVLAQIGVASAIGDANVARAAGAFATVEAASPALCERACEDDTICMAWSFQANVCELRATMPIASVREGVVSGFSRRVPAPVRARAEAPRPALSAAGQAEQHAETAGAGLEIRNETDASLALLGGPETEQGLRGGLGN